MRDIKCPTSPFLYPFLHHPLKPHCINIYKYEETAICHQGHTPLHQRGNDNWKICHQAGFCDQLTRSANLPISLISISFLPVAKNNNQQVYDPCPWHSNMVPGSASRPHPRPRPRFAESEPAFYKIARDFYEHLSLKNTALCDNEKIAHDFIKP